MNNILKVNIIIFILLFVLIVGCISEENENNNNNDLDDEIEQEYLGVKAILRIEFKNNYTLQAIEDIVNQHYDVTLHGGSSDGEYIGFQIGIIDLPKYNISSAITLNESEEIENAFDAAIVKIFHIKDSDEYEIRIEGNPNSMAIEMFEIEKESLEPFVDYVLSFLDEKCGLEDFSESYIKDYQPIAICE